MKTKTIILSLFFIGSKLCGQEVESFSLETAIKMDGIYKDGDTLYIAEGWDGNRVFKVLPSGEVTTLATGLNGPVALVKRENGNLYVSEWNASRISVINPLGEVEVYASISAGPGPMTMDDAETIYITHNVNDGSGIITTIDIAGTISILAEGIPLINPGGIDFGSDGNLYVANFNDGNIIQITPDTTLSVIGTVPSEGFWKTGYITAGNNKLFVSGISSHKIYTVDFDGTISEYAGSGELGHVDGPLETSQFAYPSGMVMDDENNILYITKAFGAANYIQFIDIGFAGNTAMINNSTPISIYPNPSNGLVQLNVPDAADAHISVFNFSGELVQDFNVVSASHAELNLSGLSGVFMVKVITTNNVFTARIIIV